MTPSIRIASEFNNFCDDNNVTQRPSSVHKHAIQLAYTRRNSEQDGERYYDGNLSTVYQSVSHGDQMKEATTNKHRQETQHRLMNYATQFS